LAPSSERRSRVREADDAMTWVAGGASCASSSSCSRGIEQGAIPSSPPDLCSRTGALAAQPPRASGCTASSACAACSDDESDYRAAQHAARLVVRRNGPSAADGGGSRAFVERARLRSSRGPHGICTASRGELGAGQPRYADCAFGDRRPGTRDGLQFDRVIVANGSAGTRPGWWRASRCSTGTRWSRGYSFSADEAVALENTRAMSRGCAALLPVMTRLPRARHRGDGACGPGYGQLTREAVDAVRSSPRTKGLLLDPVYSAKAFAGLLGRPGAASSRPRGEHPVRHEQAARLRCSAYREQLSSPPPASSRNQG